MSQHEGEVQNPLLHSSEATEPASDTGKSRAEDTGTTWTSLSQSIELDDEDHDLKRPTSPSSGTWGRTVTSCRALLSAELACWALGSIATSQKSIGGSILGASPYILGSAAVWTLPYLDRKRSQLMPTVASWFQSESGPGEAKAEADVEKGVLAPGGSESEAENRVDIGLVAE